MESVRNRILTAAKELFIKQGYKKTTIRQIVNSTGILTGSIYHFFQNKDDLFLAILSDLSSVVDGYIVERFGEDILPRYRYSALILMELSAMENDDMVHELYQEAYSAAPVFRAIVEQHKNYTLKLFGNCNFDFTEEDYYLKALAATGLMYSMITSLDHSRFIPLPRRLSSCLDTSLGLYPFSKAELDDSKIWVLEHKKEIEEIAHTLRSDTIFK